ncbi:MAG TPA: sigma-70 family RNA polymerase sigma factor, partial [Actinomycetota bacterium]|nr:sigma-70 family RNA polymerase sigma factor [Actinomycetota bacterium]
GMELVEQLADLGPALRKLSQDERNLLSLRFHHDLSQHEIASRLGVSQMQVSRLLARTIERLRDGMRVYPEAPAATAESPTAS